jgi:RNA polymerase sigma-70 factor (ECF subfamily)
MKSPLADLDDAALIEMAKAGDHESFAALMDRHMSVVRRRLVCFSPGEPETDDLLQEVQIKVWRGLSSFRSDSSFRTWMTRVALNEVLQARRRRAGKPVCQPFGAIEYAASAQQSPHYLVTRRENIQAIRAAILELPELYRQVVDLREIQELSTEQAAQSLRATVGAVKSRLLRARLKLSAALDRPGMREQAVAGV